MIDCRFASFSAALQQQRVRQAQGILGEKVVDRILCFALYLLGFERSSIAELTGCPAGTVRSIVRAVLHGGVPAFEDRRRRSSTFLPQQQPKQPNRMVITVGRQEQGVNVDFEGMGGIQIPRENSLQARVVLLTLLNNGLVDKAIAFISSKIIGGRYVRSPIEDLGLSNIDQALNMRNIKWQNFGDDLCVEGYLRKI